MIKETSKPVVTARLLKNKTGRTVRRQSLYAHYFFVAMASLFIVFAVVGFGQDYQLIYTFIKSTKPLLSGNNQQ